MNDNIELKPCPFCGASQVRVELADGWVIPVIHCEGCGAGVSFCSTRHEEEAAAAWNRRADNARCDKCEEMEA